MAERSYWLDLFTAKTWAEFLKAGGVVSGFRASQWNQVRQIKSGDILVAYLTGVSRFVGVLEVTSEAFRDATRIWADDEFPARLKVKVVAALDPETAVPVGDILDRFSWAPELHHPAAWTGHFRASPRRLTMADGEMVVLAIEDAVANPVRRAVDARKLAMRPRGTKTGIGPVVIPEPEPGADESAAEPTLTPAETSAHTRIQGLLLKLGSDLGLEVWVARNDRGREWAGRRFDAIRGFRHELPRQFDPVTSRTIELIDVLWLDKNSIEAAFEIESTSSIYSGLLRMADLLALQPNLKIPLFIVAPDERRDRVIAEVNRPVFRKMDPPLAEVCQFLSFTALQHGIEQVAPFVRRVDSGIVRDWAESVDIEEA